MSINLSYMLINFQPSSYPQLNVTVNAPQMQGGRQMTAEDIAASQNNLRSGSPVPLDTFNIFRDILRLLHR